MCVCVCWSGQNLKRPLDLKEVLYSECLLIAIKALHIYVFTIAFAKSCYIILSFYMKPDQSTQ